MKSCGMSFDVSLKDINIGMPRNLADMDALGQQSLYLIKVSHESYVSSISI